jgi:hypothetical protein
MQQIVVEHRGHIVEEYDFCPFCHRGMNPHMVAYGLGERLGRSFGSITVIWKCPFKNCEKNVVAEYLYESTGDHQSNYKFSEFLNGSPILPIWPDFLQKLENGNPDDPAIKEPSKFIEIYKQAMIAEFKGLNEIAGIGFRRAF